MKTNTHIVIKREDIFKYLTDNQIKVLDVVLNTIADGRKKDGKKPDNSYYIRKAQKGDKYMWQRATTGASGGAVSLDNVKIYMTEDTASGTFTLSANPKMVGVSYVQTQKYPKDPWVELKDGDTGVRLSDGSYYATLS